MGLFGKKKERDIDTYLEGYSKSNNSLGAKLTSLLGGFNGIDDDLLENLLVVLIEADVGVTTSEKIIDMLKSRIQENFISTRKGCINALIDVMTEVYNEENVPELVFEKGQTKPYFTFPKWDDNDPSTIFLTPREAFAALIDRISGRGTWQCNPWVFVYEFELIK